MCARQVQEMTSTLMFESPASVQNWWLHAMGRPCDSEALMWHEDQKAGSSCLSPCLRMDHVQADHRVHPFHRAGIAQTNMNPSQWDFNDQTPLKQSS